MFPQITVSKLKYLRGFLPINKPKGVHCNILLSCLKKDLNFVISRSGIPPPFLEINYARPLEPFANGLITIVFGTSNVKKRNFAFADYKYLAKLELGLERRYNCIDGEITGFANYNHVTKDMVQDKIKEYICEVQQYKSDFISESDHYCAYTNDVDIYKLIRFDKSSEDLKILQKYPLSKQPRISKCHNIQLLDFNLPFVSLEVECQGSFSVRRLIHDIGEKLESKANLIELTRVKEGPITLKDDRVISLHDVNLEYYIDRLSAIQASYRDYITSLDENFEKEYSKRTF